MWHEDVARRLSRAQRDLLIQHIDRPQRYDRHNASFDALMAKRLLYPVHPAGVADNSPRPRYTATTEDGRAVTGWVLAYYIEELVRAGVFSFDEVDDSPNVASPRVVAPSINPPLTRMAYGPIKGRPLHEVLKPPARAKVKA